MRRLIPVLVYAVLITPACNRKPHVETIEEASPPSTEAAANIIHTAEPGSAPQLISGFYHVENNAWRWTMGHFAVLLRTPVGAVEKGATLTFRFAIPEPILAKSKGRLTLSAKVNGTPLPAEVYTKPGEQTYTKDVPSSVLSSPSVKAEFTIDPILPAGSLETREIGLVASSFGLEIK
jgi:hypothetical protein